MNPSYRQVPPLKRFESGGEDLVGKWYARATWDGHLVGPEIGPFDTFEEAETAAKEVNL